MGIERGSGSLQNRNVSIEQVPVVTDGGLERKGLQIWGDVKFQADAVLRGEVKGSVIGREKVIVTEGTVVTGSVEGSDVRVDGEVQGGVVGRGRVWIGPRAKVKVRTSGRVLRIEPGAEFKGELQVG